MPSIIQFFHPGPEHDYDSHCTKTNSYYKDWHTVVNKKGRRINHKRKFLLNEGSYIDNNKKNTGKLLFWGEWEPPSRVIKLEQQTYFSPYGVNPKYIHIPFLPPDNQIEKYQNKIFQNRHYYQNTDPFIFGDNFIYAICRQKERMKFLKDLEEGSLILFGSRVNWRFVIDTVFVVNSKHKYSSLEDITKMKLNMYPEIVTKFILNKKNKVGDPQGLTLYKGAVFNNTESKMYSFVPARVYTDQEIGFPRFFMPDNFYKSKFSKYLITPKTRNGKIFEGCNMGVKISKNINTDEIYEFWKYIKDEVSRNYVLGINFKMPAADKNLGLPYPFTEHKKISLNGNHSTHTQC